MECADQHDPSRGQEEQTNPRQSDFDAGQKFLFQLKIQVRHSTFTLAEVHISFWPGRTSPFPLSSSPLSLPLSGAWLQVFVNQIKEKTIEIREPVKNVLEDFAR